MKIFKYFIKKCVDIFGREDKSKNIFSLYLEANSNRYDLDSPIAYITNSEKFGIYYVGICGPITDEQKEIIRTGTPIYLVDGKLSTTPKNKS